MEKHYILVDTNENFYNCGHYAEWSVEEREGPLPATVPTTRRGTPLAYTSNDEAAATAARLNRASSEAWRAFLDA